MNRLFQQRFLQFLWVLGACLIATSAMAAPELRVFGVNDELARQIKLSVGKPTHESDRATLRFIDGLPHNTNQALAAVGYFSAEVKANRSQSRDGDFIDLRITLNDPTRVNTINLNIEGDARADAEFMRNLGELPIRTNAIFLSQDYESAKSRLLDAAQDLGYFDFKFIENEVRVSRKNLTADITLIGDSGKRYTFGPVTYEQGIFPEQFLQRWTPFAEGDHYSSDKIAETIADLQGSGYFSSVRVVPQRDALLDKTVPVTIALERKDDNLVSIGVGYATDTEFRTRLTWTRPLLNRFGHSLELGLGYSQVQQSASIAYRIPRRVNPLTNYYSIEYGVQNEPTLDNSSFLSTLVFQRTRLLPSQFQESIFLRWERERFEIGDQDAVSTDLVLPGVSWSRSRSKGRPFVTWGQSVSFELYGGSKELFSSVDIVKAVFNFKYLRAVSDRNTLIGSVQYGAIASNSFERVPVSQRFFAGGDRSIRGFPFLEVSPTNDEGEFIGGRYLEALSLEHNYRFFDKWSSALFVDAGRSFNDFDTPYSVGAGVGIRWQSPVGPFRIDVAVPLSEFGNDPRPRVHLSLGPDL